jgi:hypothetical protein
MQLQLKNIKYNSSLSDETYAYSANLYLDGKKIGYVANRGHGGADEQRIDDAQIAKDIDAYFASLPKEHTHLEMNGEPFMVQPDLESWCHDQITDYLTLKDIKKACARNVIGFKDGEEFRFSKIDNDTIDKVGNLTKPLTIRQYLERKHPGMKILNGLSDAEILATVKQGS